MRGWGISREKTGVLREGARNLERERVDAGKVRWEVLGEGHQRPRERTETQRREDQRQRARKRGQRWMQRWQSLAGSEVRVSVRSAAVQGWPGAPGPRVGGCK